MTALFRLAVATLAIYALVALRGRQRKGWNSEFSAVGMPIVLARF